VGVLNDEDHYGSLGAQSVEVMRIVSVVVLAYLLGSFPAGYLLGKLWGVNVLRFASGRTGGTNVLRAAGAAAGLLTGALDVGKGFLAVWLAGQITGSPVAESLAGGAVVLGHCYSVFLRFRGGGGVATSLGAAGAIYLPLAVVLLVLLVLVIALSRMASVGSLTVTTLLPISLLVLGLIGTLPLIYTLYGALAWMVIVYSHLPNIRRLIAGTERRLGEPRE
jgi:glycerol-3-phosphate acyltransferase PlsY